MCEETKFFCWDFKKSKVEICITSLKFEKYLPIILVL